MNVVRQALQTNQCGQIPRPRVSSAVLLQLGFQLVAAVGRLVQT